MYLPDEFDGPIILQVPAVIKAHIEKGSERRLIEVEASNETVDADGDVVLQKSLLDAAPIFIAMGHFDMDHKSEFGARLGIKDPSSYIVGRPLEVYPGPESSTLVKGEIRRPLDGAINPTMNRYDELWASLQSDPPVKWLASIYGWPTDVIDCRGYPEKALGTGATRFIVKAIDWRSLAFTRTPKNMALKSAARILTAKSYMAELAKCMEHKAAWIPASLPDAMQPCPNCRVHETPSLMGYRKHFSACKGCEDGVSDILAHAAMHRHNMDRAIPLRAPSVISGLPALTQ